MGLFFKHKIIGHRPHEVIRKDWENVIEALYKYTIANYAKGIAVICNTSRQNPEDGAGSVQNEMIYHIRPKRGDEVRVHLKKIDLAHFEIIFKNYFDGKQKGLDFYRIKSILAKEIMVYPLMQGEGKKGLLVFDYPIADSNTIQIMKVIADVLNNLEVQSTPLSDAASDDE
tara:strand:+ start:473 stop:985 length:513 start_codon:yes stop_codon:yes gene_type:complete